MDDETTPRRDGALKIGSVLFRSHGERLLEQALPFWMIQVVPTGHEAITLGLSKAVVRPFGQVGSLLLECGFCELFAKKALAARSSTSSGSAKSHDC